MKRLETTLDDRQFELARRALRVRGVSGFTVSAVLAEDEVADEARPTARARVRGRFKIEVVAHDDMVGRVVALLAASLRATDRPGEIHVFAVEHALRIRTDEIDEAAIS